MNKIKKFYDNFRIRICTPNTTYATLGKTTIDKKEIFEWVEILVSGTFMIILLFLTFKALEMQSINAHNGKVAYFENRLDSLSVEAEKLESSIVREMDSLRIIIKNNQTLITI
jgi:hypothetical protein